jgi:hypothetical protein
MTDATANDSLQLREAEVTARLDKVMRRAKAVEKDAVDLFARIRPLMAARKQFVAVTEGHHPGVLGLTMAARVAAHAAGREIAELVVGLPQEVALRLALAEALTDADCRLRATVMAPSDAWFTAIETWRGQVRKSLESRRAWLTSVEERWHPPAADDVTKGSPL